MMSPSGFLRSGGHQISNGTPIVNGNQDSKYNSTLFQTAEHNNGTADQRSTWTLENSLSAIDVRRMELLQV